VRQFTKAASSSRRKVLSEPIYKQQETRLAAIVARGRCLRVHTRYATLGFAYLMRGNAPSLVCALSSTLLRCNTVLIDSEKSIAVRKVRSQWLPIVLDPSAFVASERAPRLPAFGNLCRRYSAQRLQRNQFCLGYPPRRRHPQPKLIILWRTRTTTKQPQ